MLFNNPFDEEPVPRPSCSASHMPGSVKDGSVESSTCPMPMSMSVGSSESVRSADPGPRHSASYYLQVVNVLLSLGLMASLLKSPSFCKLREEMKPLVSEF